MEEQWAPCILIATRMLTTDFSSQTSPSKLNGELIAELRQIECLVKSEGGMFMSRQAIALAIVNWQKRNPDQVAYQG